MRAFSALIVRILSFYSTVLLAAETDLASLPVELKAHVAPNTVPIFFAKADLNGDTREDAILVLEAQPQPQPQPPQQDPEAYVEGNPRILLILISNAEGVLVEAKRSAKLVYCSTCGGVMGDPFQGVEAGLKTFSVSHYGGSSWCWTADYQFNYSRKDQTWQLVRVEESSFHASVPDKVEHKRYTPPKDFGKIDIADFDPEHWKGQGLR